MNSELSSVWRHSNRYKFCLRKAGVNYCFWQEFGKSCSVNQESETTLKTLLEKRSSCMKNNCNLLLLARFSGFLFSFVGCGREKNGIRRVFTTPSIIEGNAPWYWPFVRLFRASERTNYRPATRAERFEARSCFYEKETRSITTAFQLLTIESDLIASSTKKYSRTPYFAFQWWNLVRFVSLLHFSSKCQNLFEWTIRFSFHHFDHPSIFFQSCCPVIQVCYHVIAILLGK